MPFRPTYIAQNPKLTKNTHPNYPPPKKVYFLTKKNELDDESEL